MWDSGRHVPCPFYNIQINEIHLKKKKKKAVKGTREYPGHAEGEDRKTDPCLVELGQWMGHPTASGFARCHVLREHDSPPVAPAGSHEDKHRRREEMVLGGPGWSRDPRRLRREAWGKARGNERGGLCRIGVAG